MDFTEIVKARRSIRKYQDKAVDDGLLSEILEAGRLAPTATNGQNWYCLVVRNRALCQAMVEVCGGQGLVGEAPVNLVVCGINNRSMFCGQPINTVDCSIVTTMMMLKATELGLGTCWLGHFSADGIRALLDIPAKDEVVAVLPLGYGAEAPEARPRKALSAFFSFRD